MNQEFYNIIKIKLEKHPDIGPIVERYFLNFDKNKELNSQLLEDYVEDVGILLGYIADLHLKQYNFFIKDCKCKEDKEV